MIQDSESYRYFIDSCSVTYDDIEYLIAQSCFLSFHKHDVTIKENGNIETYSYEEIKNFKLDSLTIPDIKVFAFFYTDYKEKRCF